MPISIVIASHHRLVRQGLLAMLRGEGAFVVVGEARDAEEMAIHVRDAQPDIVLVDLEMPEVSGLVATLLIRECWPAVRVLAMASRGDEELVYMAMQTGAWGYVAKEAGRQVLIETIKAAYSGEVMVLPFLAHLALQGAFALSQVPAVRAEPLLSALEVRMLRLMEQGVPPTAIGSRLHLSQQELSAHLRGVFAKLPLSPDLRAATTTLRRKLCAD